MLLSVSQITKTFDGIVALRDISLEFAPHSITTIVGPNGSGKTTLFNIITGFTTPDSGDVFLDGVNIVGRSPHLIATSGVGRLFQTPRIFKGLSVLDNLQVAANFTVGDYPFSALFRLREVARQQHGVSERAHQVIGFLGLTHLVGVDPSTLSYGQMKLLAIGQLLMMESSVLLLDEPTAGLDENATQNILGILRQLADQGRTVVLIEHRWELVKPICDFMAVLNAGRLITVGQPGEVISNFDSFEGLW